MARRMENSWGVPEVSAKGPSTLKKLSPAAVLACPNSSSIISAFGNFRLCRPCRAAEFKRCDLRPRR